MFELPALPYAYDALEPVMSDRTLRFHHDKHHGAYVKTTNEVIEKAGGPADQSLEDIIRDAARAQSKKLFNNAAQAWNHSFFWTAMSPERQRPDGALAAAISRTFGDLGGLKGKFVEEGVGHFGSGWAWLVCDREGRLAVRATHDADDTLTQSGLTPLIVCDLWEHAYYLDHQNDRKGFLDAWFDQLPNWDFAAQQFAAATGEGQAWKHPAPSAGGAQRQARAS